MEFRDIAGICLAISIAALLQIAFIWSMFDPLERELKQLKECLQTIKNISNSLNELRSSLKNMEASVDQLKGVPVEILSTRAFLADMLDIKLSNISTEISTGLEKLDETLHKDEDKINLFEDALKH